MTAETVVITGANSGIGFQAALHFARKGANVVMACRSIDKAKAAQAEIAAATSNAKTVVMKLDVSDLNSIQAFCQNFSDQQGSLDILINNAGIVAIPLARNSAGHEMQLATNYLGAFALTGTLLPMFVKDKPARIVNVCSLMHRLGKLNPDDLNWESTPYDQWKAYGNGKLAMMSYTLELNRRLQATGSKLIALGAHPGFANTNIYTNSPTLQERKKAKSSWLSRKMESLVPQADSAVRPIIIAAEADSANGGDYYGPGGVIETGIWGKPGKARINKIAKKVDLAKQLWNVSEKMTGISYLSDV